MAGNIQIDQLVRSLLQKESLEECTLQELENFAGRHPYFGAAQLLLTKKMQLEKSDGYREQLEKTYLFFNNPLWVQRLLGVESAAVAETTAGTEQPAVSSEPSPDESQHTAVNNEPLVNGNVQELKEPEAEGPKTGGKEKEELLFEPYHTVDYFASQGIKYKPEEKPLDKFGQQLKSFTDWLKEMKRLPVAEIAKQAEPAAEKQVEQMAERSLQEKDVLTEAMADVWVKQGNREKAREIYRKLSLLEPSKSAYFAAKIEELQ